MQLLTPDGTLIDATTTSDGSGSAAGTYLFSDLPAGEYYVGFRAADGFFADEWWDDVPRIDGATPVAATPGSWTDGVDCATNGSRDCAAGFTCVIFSDADGNELSRECKQTCDVGNAVCASGSCQAFTTPLAVNGNEYGFCD